jgi:hypothetical protein
MFGDVLTFANAVMAKAGAKQLQTNAQCWKLITQGGRTLQVSSSSSSSLYIAIFREVEPEVQKVQAL